MRLVEGLEFLAEGGLNLAAVLDTAVLPHTAVYLLAGSGVPLETHRRLVLTGHGGPRLWQALQGSGMEGPDPVDSYSTALTRQFIHDYLDDVSVHWLYPGTSYVLPLQQLGEAAGWSYPSPLGSGISPVYGVWFAYRTAFLTDADLPIVCDTPQSSPCESCADKPCISACPVNAVRLNAFDIDACVGRRLAPASTCADRCLARMACPFFPEQRYSLAQIQYHYGRSLQTLRSWYAENE